MEYLFSTYCNKCQHMYILGVCSSDVPPNEDTVRYCPHCGSSNTNVKKEKSVLKDNPYLEVGTVTVSMTASDVRNAKKSLNFGKAYGMGAMKYNELMGNAKNDDAVDALKYVDFAEAEARILGMPVDPGTVTVEYE